MLRLEQSFEGSPVQRDRQLRVSASSSICRLLSLLRTDVLTLSRLTDVSHRNLKNKSSRSECIPGGNLPDSILLTFADLKDCTSLSPRKHMHISPCLFGKPVDRISTRYKALGPALPLPLQHHLTGASWKFLMHKYLSWQSNTMQGTHLTHLANAVKTCSLRVVFHMTASLILICQAQATWDHWTLLQ